MAKNYPTFSKKIRTDKFRIKPCQKIKACVFLLFSLNYSQAIKNKKASSYEPTPREKDVNPRWQKAPYRFPLFSYRSLTSQRAFY